MPKVGAAVNAAVNGSALKPDWQTPDGRIQLYCADCLDVLPDLTGVQTVVTSPPYNQMNNGTPSGMYKENARGDLTGKWDLIGYEDEEDEESYQRQQIRVAKMLLRCTDETASLFYNHPAQVARQKVLTPSYLVQPVWMEIAAGDTMEPRRRNHAKC